MKNTNPGILLRTGVRSGPEDDTEQGVISPVVREEESDDDAS